MFLRYLKHLILTFVNQIMGFLLTSSKIKNYNEDVCNGNPYGCLYRISLMKPDGIFRKRIKKKYGIESE